MSNPGKDQIRGWKEIASYFDRDERTVKRWEKQRALPVRRIPGEGRANVYIVVSEAEAWLAAGNHVADSLPAGRNSSSADNATQTGLSRATNDVAALPEQNPDLKDDEDEETIDTAGPVLDPPRSAASQGNRARSLAVLLLGAAVLVLAGAVLRGHLHTHRGSSGQSSAGPVRHPPQDKADALYLQGVYFNEQRTPADLKRALDDFQAAIALDPGRGRAYAGLAITYLLLREFGTMPEAEAYVNAEAAAQNALLLDPNLPEAHASLGFIAFFSSWNPQLATREFTTALRLDSGCVVAHHWYGAMLMHRGMYTEALQQLDIAQQLEPTSSAILSTKAYALGLSGRRDEAMDLLQPLVTANSAVASPHRTLATLSLLPPRDIERYLDEMRRSAEIRQSQDITSMLAYGTAAFHRGGEQQMWAAMLAREKELHPSADQPTYFMADMEAALGFEDEAIREIAILAKRHDPAIIGIGIDPLLNPLRHNPRFQQIVASVGLKPRA